VAWVFEKRGVVLVDAERFDEEDLLPAIDAGADDVARDGDLFKVTSDPASLAEVREALEAADIEVQESDLAMEPKNVVEVTGESEARRLMRLLETLDDHDDVDSVHANFDIPAELLEQATA
jgi:transcriptional/translational regulatory protein YebC/TACO1